MLLVALGGLAGLALWLAWEPTTRECDTLGECLGRAFTGAVLAALVVVAGLVALWLLRLRPVFLTTLFAVACGGALVLSLTEVVAVGGPGPRHSVAPVWSWVLICAVVLPLVHWLLQPERSWTARVVPLVVIGMVVWAATAWAQDERRDRRLAELESVGVDRVLLPSPGPGHELVGSWRFSGLDPQVDYISMSYRPTGSGAAYLNGKLVPVGDREPCEVVLVVMGQSDRGDCARHGDSLVLQTETDVGAGVVRGETLLLVTGAADHFTVQELQDAVAGARTGTVEDLLPG